MRAGRGQLVGPSELAHARNRPVLLVTPAMRTAITEGRTAAYEISATADPNHVTMRRDGLIKASVGLTTVDEVLRATQDTDLGSGNGKKA